MDQFIAEIRMFGCNFAPNGWALCAGQLLAIRSNTALFSLLGVNYGGDGITTFGLPNLQGQAALGQGQGPGLSPYVIGETVGSSTVTLIQGELAIHAHGVNCSTDAAANPSPAGNVLAAGADRSAAVYSDGSTGSVVPMNPAQIGFSGNNIPHNNMSPYQVVNYCIALQGIFPSRS
jgi:microcystin-dependent protein